MNHAMLLLFSTSLLCSNSLSSTLSSQGFTGLVNTPNAQVLKVGDAIFHYNNQFDNHLRYYNELTPKVAQDDYIFGIGFLSNFELTGRLSEVEAFTQEREDNIGFELRDISVNAKIKLPIDSEYLPNIAVGFQDLGSKSSYYSNVYAVADKEIGFVRASLGFGKSGENKAGKRMDGLFGGVEAKVMDELSILAEHDGKENHVAIRMRMPKSWSNTFSVDATIAQNLSVADTSMAINVSIPLFHNRDNRQIVKKENNEKSLISTKNLNAHSQKQLKEEKKYNISDETLIAIQNKLVKIGFENVQVGRYRESIYIKCENSIFDHTDLDALGYILGTVSQVTKKKEHFIVTLLKNNLQTLTMSGNSHFFRAYLEKPNKENEITLKNDLKFSRTFDETHVKFVTKKENSSFFKPRLELSPGLTTTVGTEVGLFDYLVALRANAYTNLYDGLTLSAMYEMPLGHSNNFNKDKTYGIQYKDKLENRLVNAQLHQTLHYESLLNTTSIGRFQENYNGILNQTNLTTTSGEHGVALRVGEFEDKNNNTLAKKNVYIGSYRYFYAPLDLFTEVSYGQYWNQDKGGMLQFKRYFGETEVALYLKNTEKSYAGFKVTIPLTWRKSTNYALGQLKGKKDFNYGIGTVVGSAQNTVTSAIAVTPKTDLELATHYLDKDRLNASYILRHLDRMREAYLSYGLFIDKSDISSL